VNRPGTQVVRGGCALNTVRVLQWLGGSSTRSALLGGVGDDQEGRLIQVTLVLVDTTCNVVFSCIRGYGFNDIFGPYMTST
jgi:sugar/nucleoside kinase (ribokinase family)